MFSLFASGGFRAISRNLLIAVGCAVVAFGLIQVFGNPVQWIALAIGAYAFLSWVQGLKLRDRPTFELIYRSRSMIYGMFGFGWMAFVGYGLGFWAPTFFRRVHDQSAGEAGLILGLTAAVAGWLGVAGGGWFSDRVKRKRPNARPLCGIIIAVGSIPLGAFFVLTENVTTAYVMNFFFTVFGSAWIGSAVAMANDLVLPRMRGTASAFYILMMTFVGLALGPFLMGWLSTTLEAGGVDSGRSLQLAMLASLGAYVLGVIFFWLAGRSVASDESTRIERAQAVGEVVEAA